MADERMPGRGTDRIIDRRIMGQVRAREDCPHYSTDLRDAWLIVERMRQHKQFGNLTLTAYAYARTYATFAMYGFDDLAMTAEANGEHATPTAICIAALLACPEGEDVWRHDGIGG